MAELHRLGVRHLARLRVDVPPVHIPPVELLASLAAHGEARMRSALVLLFLRQPELADHVVEALKRVNQDAAHTLRLYYEAAVYIQAEIEPQLRAGIEGWRPLPDLFSSELGLPPAADTACEAGLTALGKLHRRLSGWSYNWSGSYRQYIPIFLKHLKRTHAGHHNP